MKKIMRYTVAFLVALALIMLAVNAAWAKDTAQLDYADIALRVPKENKQMDLLQRTLPVLQKSYDSMVSAGKDIDSMTNILRDLDMAYTNAAKIPDLSQLDQSLIQVLQGSLRFNQMSLGSINLDSINQQVAQTRIQIEQTQAALINGGQQLFVGYHQLQDNISKMRDNRLLLEDGLQLTKVQQTAGLGTALAVKEAELSLAELDTAILQMESQGAIMLNQLKLIVGWPQGQIIKLGGMPKPNREFFGKIDLSADTKSAQDNSYSLKLKQQEYKFTSSDDQKVLIKLNMDAQTEQIALSVSNQYYKIEEKNSTLLLEEQRLAVAEEKIKQSRLQHQVGILTSLALQVEEKNYTAQQEAVTGAMDALFWEIENYKAIVAGLN